MAGYPANVVLGFDYGLRRIGVAVGQTITCTATPVGIARATDGAPDWRQIERWVAEWRPDRIVVGLPRHEDGTDHPLEPRIRRFANRLRGRFGLTVDFIDEHLSSAAASDRVAPGEPLDAVAAQVILETWLRAEHARRAAAPG